MYIHKSYKFRILEVNMVNKIHAGKNPLLAGGGGGTGGWGDIKLAVIYT